MATCEKLRQRKKVIFKYLILSLHLALVFIMIACCGGGDTDVPDPHIPAVASTSILDIPPSTISSPSGDTRIQQVGADVWIPATEGMKIVIGDRLQTGDDGTVLLIFFEGSIMEIGVNSEVIVTDLDFSSDSRSTTVKLKQIVGDTVNRVEKLVDPACLYEVSAPAGVASVRGTLFELKVDTDGYTEVACQEGQVSFTAAGITVSIEENMASSALPGEAPAAPSPMLTIVPAPNRTPAVTPTPIAEKGQVTTQTPAKSYSIVEDFSLTENDENSTWSYRYSSDLLRDGVYTLTTDISDNSSFWNPLTPFWTVPKYAGIGVNKIDAPIIFVANSNGFEWPANTVWMHPPSDGLAIISWLCKLDGKVNISYSFEDIDPNGITNSGTGIKWYVDKGDSTNMLASGTIDEGRDATDILELTNISVNVGDRINFVVDPNGNFRFDSTGFTAQISYIE